VNAWPIIDAHAHIGEPGGFFLPQTGPEDLVAVMDRLGIGATVQCDHRSLVDGCDGTLSGLREVHERSGGRLYYLAAYDPHRPRECLGAIRRAVDWPGLCGIKIHPSFHSVPAEDDRYLPIWELAAELDLAMLTHSWSVSTYNPSQAVSTPERFERFIRRFPQVRFVLGHAGGRGSGRREAVRLCREYPNVSLDIAGDIFCLGLVEDLVAAVSDERVLFGSDYPWMDPRANLSRVLLADLDPLSRQRILRDNAMRVYRTGGTG